MEEYYIAQNNKQKGPFSLEELKELKVLPTTLIWKEGMSDWIEAINVEELETLFKSTPPALPKKKGEKNIPQNKTLDVNLKVKKRESKPKSAVDKITIQRRKTVIAKKIKLVGRIFLYSIIIGLISYPFFARKGFEALYLKKKYVVAKYDFIDGYYIRSNKEIDEMWGYEARNQIKNLIPERWVSSEHYRYSSILDNLINDMKEDDILYYTLL